MTKFKIGDRIAAITVDVPTHGTVTQVENVPNSPDTGKPRIEVQWDDGGFHQYWEVGDLSHL